jgi:dephospho-CoA kinase
VIAVGLTGGIGSGKSTVACLMAERGAVVIDADAIARQVVEPGGPAYQGVVERFGPGVVAADGTIDRPALAAVVFGDAEALADLNRLTHPAIGAEISRRLAEEAGGDRVVVLDVPLLVEAGRRRPELAAVVVVDVPEELALARLIEGRNMDPDDVRARMARQASRQERLAMADYVIDNSGGLDSLAQQVDRAMEWIRSLPATGGRAPG